MLTDFLVENDVSRQYDLVKNQRAEKGLCSMFQVSIGAEEVKLENECVYVKSGVLMRKWRSL